MTSSPPQPKAAPALLFHSLDQVRFALNATDGFQPTPAFTTAPGAAAFLGVGWFLAVLEALRPVCSDIESRVWLDCDTAAGQAVTALKAGCHQIIFTGHGAPLEVLQGLALEKGAHLRQERFSVFDLQALDLVKPTEASLQAAAKNLQTWLQSANGQVS